MNSNAATFASPLPHPPPDDAVPTDAQTVRVAVKGYVRLTESWSLVDRDAAALLDVPPRTWQRMKREGWSGRLTKDQVLRIGLLVGIHHDLASCFGPQIAPIWPRLDNGDAPFGGRTPVQYMIDGALPAFMHVRQRVASMSQGT